MAAALPRLRQELAVLPGPAGPDGAPNWTLHDPLSNRYFRLSWPAFEILSRWHLGDAEAVAAAVSEETTLGVDAEDVGALLHFLSRGQLLLPRGGEDVDRLIASHDAARISLFTWLLHHYLFFRLPLLRPDAFLGRALPQVAWLGGSTFRRMTLAALLLGLMLVTRQWDRFVATFVDHVSLTGLVAFGIALGSVKLVHELGHAFTAKHFGCRVPTMGVAFLVMWPMLYTDVNEAWKLTDRRQRLLVGGAGILTELFVAAWATLAWALLPDGTSRAMTFTLAATTWISTLAINLSPFMRFDGYFLAMDAFNQPNLHPRSFALARWRLRELLFDLGEPPPEPLPPRTRAVMIAFAWAVWLYRLVLFLGIALLVYHFFIKVVGIVLFAVEVGWFVLRPILGEIGAWYMRLPAIRAARRGRWLLLAGFVLLLVLAVPWSGRIAAPALLKAESHAGLFAPLPGIVVDITAREGEMVTTGTPLLTLDNPDSRHRLAEIEARIAALRYELSASGFDDEFRARSKSTAEELAAALAEKLALETEIGRLTLEAPITGKVADLSHEVQIGQWITPREPLLSLRAGAVIEAYVAEADLPRLMPGATASFIPEGRGSAIASVVVGIDRASVKTLTEPVLAAQYGGRIAARFDNKGLVPEQAVYRLRLKPRDPVEAAVPLRGEALIDGERRSMLGDALRSAAAILIREWGM